MNKSHGQWENTMKECEKQFYREVDMENSIECGRRGTNKSHYIYCADHPIYPSAVCDKSTQTKPNMCVTCGKEVPSSLCRGVRMEEELKPMRVAAHMPECELYERQHNVRQSRGTQMSPVQSPQKLPESALGFNASWNVGATYRVLPAVSDDGSSGSHKSYSFSIGSTESLNPHGDLPQPEAWTPSPLSPRPRSTCPRSTCSRSTCPRSTCPRSTCPRSTCPIHEAPCRGQEQQQLDPLYGYHSKQCKQYEGCIRGNGKCGESGEKQQQQQQQHAAACSGILPSEAKPYDLYSCTSTNLSEEKHHHCQLPTETVHKEPHHNSSNSDPMFFPMDFNQARDLIDTKVTAPIIRRVHRNYRANLAEQLDLIHQLNKIPELVNEALFNRANGKS